MCWLTRGRGLYDRRLTAIQSVVTGFHADPVVRVGSQVGKNAFAGGELCLARSLQLFALVERLHCGTSSDGCDLTGFPFDVQRHWWGSEHVNNVWSYKMKIHLRTCVC